MKRYTLFTLLAVAFAICPVLAQDETDFRSPETWLLGYFEADILMYEPHSQWYTTGFDEYEPDQDAITELASVGMDDVKVLIVLGTWCPDSRREVPRFMKIAGLTGIEEEAITFLGTDSYKIAPIDNYDELEIERVPTFIFYRDKVELGRIIEYPVSSLERDMIQILQKSTETEH